MLIEIMADIVCPWCYVGRRRLQRALARRPRHEVRLVWRPFQLNPDMPPEGMDRQAYLAAKFGPGTPALRLMETVAAAGAAEGIGFRFDRIERMPNSLNAHRLIGYAARHGRQLPMIDTLFRAYFEEGRDIGRLSILADAARQAGLDADAAAQYLASGEGYDAALADDRSARRLGISGVPCFILERRYALSGAQEPEFFLPLFDLAREDSHSSERVA